MHAFNYEETIEVLGILREARTYIQEARDEAEVKHDTYGEFYMEPSLYEIMQRTDALLERIDKLLAENR